MGKTRDIPEATRSRAVRKDAVANRQALLEAASQVFARRGFHRGNVREICVRAGVNTGAVNRHFGSKANLYKEVIVRAGRSLASQESCPVLDEFDSPQDALRAWMRYVLRLILLRKRADPVAGSLLMNEFLDPTDAMDDLVRLVIAPVRAELGPIASALMGKRATPARTAAATSFIHGLCVFQGVGAPMLARVGQPTPRTAKQIDALLAVLFPFALAGVTALADLETVPHPRCPRRRH